MAGLLRTDMKKLFRTKSLYVCLVLAAALGIAMTLLYDYFWQERGKSIALSYQYMQMIGMDTDVLDNALEALPKHDIWSFINIFFSDGMLWYLGAVCLCAYFSSEFSEGTFRNTVARGFGRTSIYFSKLLVGMSETFLLTVVYVGAGALTACTRVDLKISISPGDMTLIILTYVLLLAAMTSLFLMLCIIFRKTGIAVAAAIVAPIIVVSLLSILTMTRPDEAAEASRYVLMQTFVNVQDYALKGDGLTTIVIGAAYLVISTVTGAIVFRRCDI